MKHTAKGTLSMAVAADPERTGDEDAGGCGSIFFITLADNVTYLDGKHAPFGRCVEEESMETLRKLNEQVLTDESGKPLRDVRIRHVVVLDDPFPDPPGLLIPPNSPLPTAAQLKSLNVGEDEELPDENDDATAEEREKIRRQREARAQALTLEMVGDLPFADVAPPENVLFVCKLNAVTRSEDLELIFSRFGTIMSCEVIRDKKTGDSLNYAFIEFDKKEEAERAYMKMDNVLIDDRRIHVDFSQSVSKLHNDWVFQRTGGRPPPNRAGASSSRHHDDSRSPSAGASSSSARRHAGNGGGMVFELDDYQYKDRSKVRGNGKSRGDDRREKYDDSGSSSRRDRHEGRDRDYPRDKRSDHRDDRRRRSRSRSRERSPRRSEYRRERDNGHDRHRRNDDRRERDRR